MSPQNNAKGAGLTLLTAAVAAVTAGLCCVGPLLYLLFGICSGWLTLKQARVLYWCALALILPVLFYPTLVAWFYEVFE